MLQNSTWIHLRIPFSFRLAPVFLFAWSQMESPFTLASFLIFIVLHLCFYPASNGYNSYFDKDEDSIAGVEKPPSVTDELYYVSLVLDFVGLTISALFTNYVFFACALIDGILSKLYSHPGVRLKGRPIISWLVTGFFQGYFLFMGIIGGCSTQGLKFLSEPRLHFGGILTSLILLGIYPLTQVYQHKEDSRRGDITMSILVGVKGTFVLAGGFLISALVGFVTFFVNYYSNYSSIIVLSFVFFLPVFIYFLYWFALVVVDEKWADFKHTMNMNLVASLSMNLFYVWLTLYPSQGQKYW